MITFLVSPDGKKQTKRYWLDESGNLQKSDYGDAYWYAPGEQSVHCIDDLSKFLCALEQEQDVCVIRGKLSHDGELVRRKTHPDENGIQYFEENPNGVPWMMLDYDDVKAPDWVIDEGSAQRYLESILPDCCKDVSYHLQWSSSAGITGWSKIKAHLWFWLEEPRTDSSMREWAKLNEVDASVMGTTQPHYTAAPILQGIPSPITTRNKLVRKNKDKAAVPYTEPPARPSSAPVEATDLPPEYDVELTEALIKFIAPKIGRPDYETWNKITWAAICGAGQAPGIAIMRQYFPEENKGEYERKAKDYQPGKITLGTLVHMVQQNGGQHFVTDTIRDLHKKYEKKEIQEPEKPRLIEKELVDLDIQYINAACGEGKTHWMLQNISTQGGKWVYATDKILSIHERKREFERFQASLGSAPFVVYDIHSENSEKRVGRELRKCVEAIQASDAQNVLVFVTHKALFLMDWWDWEGFNCVVDEAAEIREIHEGDFHGDGQQILDKYIDPVEEDGECYVMGLTDWGENKAAHPSYDDAERSVEWIIKAISQPYSRVWVRKDNWMDGERKRVTFFALLTPHLLLPFTKVWIMGDELDRSPLFKIWEAQYQVNWTEFQLPTRRARKKPIGERLSVLYFTDNLEPSFTQFARANGPLQKIADYVSTLWSNDQFLWTANAKYKHKVEEYFSKCAAEDGSSIAFPDEITPKAHGRNDLQHHTKCVWLAAMKPSFIEAAIDKALSGMTTQDITRWREYNPMYQFIMRTAVRDFESVEDVVAVVVSKTQAEYMQERTGCRIKKLTIKSLIDQPNSKGGRPQKYRSEEERAAANRALTRIRVQKHRANNKLAIFDGLARDK